MSRRSALKNNNNNNIVLTASTVSSFAALLTLPFTSGTFSPQACVHSTISTDLLLQIILLHTLCKQTPAPGLEYYNLKQQHWGGGNRSMTVRPTEGQGDRSVCSARKIEIRSRRQFNDYCLPMVELKIAPAFCHPSTVGQTTHGWTHITCVSVSMLILHIFSHCYLLTFSITFPCI